MIDYCAALLYGVRGGDGVVFSERYLHPDNS